MTANYTRFPRAEVQRGIVRPASGPSTFMLVTDIAFLFDYFLAKPMCKTSVELVSTLISLLHDMPYLNGT